MQNMRPCLGFISISLLPPGQKAPKKLTQQNNRVCFLLYFSFLVGEETCLEASGAHALPMLEGKLMLLTLLILPQQQL